MRAGCGEPGPHVLARGLRNAGRGALKLRGGLEDRVHRLAEVLPEVATSQCSVVTLGALSPAPDTLNCGNAASKSTPTNGNGGQAPPAIPSTITYINNERVA